MKQFFLFASIVSLSITGMAQEAAPSSNESFIYFYRDGQFGGALSNFKMFVDEKKVCKISNDKWFKISVAPGKHDIEAKIGGTSFSKKETFLSLITEGGKSYYISCDVKRSITRSRMEMEEVVESTAQKKMAKMKEDKCNEDD
jgi:hypothetical protein